MEPNNRNNRNRGDKNRRRGGGMWSIVLWALLLTIGVNYLSVMLDQARTAESSCEIAYSELVELVEEGKVKSIEFGDTVFTITPVDGFTYTDDDGKRYDQNYTLFTTIIPDATEKLITLCDEHGVTYTKPYQPPVSPILTFMVSYILPTVLMVGAFMLLMNFIAKKSGGMGGIGGIGNVGKANAKVYMEKQTGVTFADVAGQDEAKESLTEIIDFLHNPQKYTAIGARLPKGALLVGSPGTGKTLIQRFLLDIYRRKNRGAKIICCAPTGRAARRMEQSTGFPATTIHKALGLLAGEDGDYCEPEMLDADLIVVDEVSMMDIYLANHLFRSVPHGSQLVLIGDADQLPSVGPGAVLSEIIACGAVPVVRLDRIFRQSYGSRIAANAKLIRHGNLSLEYGEDFQFYDSCDMSASAQQIETLYLQETARYGVDNVALLTPYRQKTETGVNALNERLREKLNPQDGKKPEVAYRKRIYRLGDKVMQIKNCEDISNGDIGYITSVTRDDTDSVLTVDFGDGRIAEYDGSDLEMLDLAYASTIHKSQGSEYKSVIINLQCAHAVMLVRPLVYTAITRAKERVLIVGERRALCIAIKRTDTEQRGTMLSARIKELISNVKGDHYNGNLAQ